VAGGEFACLLAIFRKGTARPRSATPIEKCREEGAVFAYGFFGNEFGLLRIDLDNIHTPTAMRRIT
jgi:hypothetical protein